MTSQIPIREYRCIETGFREGTPFVIRSINGTKRVTLHKGKEENKSQNLLYSSHGQKRDPPSVKTFTVYL